MKKYLIKRVLLAIGIIFALSCVTFVILNVIPGDPVALMLGDNADAATVKAVRANLGMDKPLPQQYLSWVLNLLTGDLGISFFQKKPVLTLLTTAFQYTVRLATISYLVAVVLGIGIGIFAAVNRGKIADHALMALAITGISAPSFWVAILLQIYVGLQFKVFPVSGLAGPISYILPCIALGTRYAAGIARITRTSMLEILNQDFIRTAEAKGLSPLRTVFIHALRNAMLPILTVIGTNIGELLTGSMLTETVFNIPGIGKLLIDSITKRDLPIVQGCVIYIAVVCVTIYLVVDILYAVIDPHIRLEGN